ncbi:MAG: histidine phosphatase family protein [Verrucomicrobiae bacterium]|nr:histidine phosphatase family protein [Verrucomicrobiae bacterium]
MAKELMLVRHATIGPQYRGCFIGSTDVPLSEEGRRQTTLLAKVLRSKVPSRCLCSPMKRSLETARFTMGDTVVPIETDPDLREVDFGNWEGKILTEIEAADPENVRRWKIFDENFCFPEGEGVSDFFKRVERMTQRLTADPGELIMVFTHGGVIRAMICYLLGLASHQYVHFDARPASVTTIEIYENKGIKGVLTGLNDRCHLRES